MTSRVADQLIDYGMSRVVDEQYQERWNRALERYRGVVKVWMERAYDRSTRMLIAEMGGLRRSVAIPDDVLHSAYFDLDEVLNTLCSELRADHLAIANVRPPPDSMAAILPPLSAMDASATTATNIYFPPAGFPQERPFDRRAATLKARQRFEREYSGHNLNLPDEKPASLLKDGLCFIVKDHRVVATAELIVRQETYVGLTDRYGEGWRDFIKKASVGKELRSLLGVGMLALLYCSDDTLIVQRVVDDDPRRDGEEKLHRVEVYR